MRRRILVDTGPLVAFLNRRDRFHDWATITLANVQPPLLTCEAVISEACFLLRRVPRGPESVLELLGRGLVETSFRLADDLDAVTTLMQRYADLPISFADACMVRLAERTLGSTVMTVDSDFKIYRMLGRRVVPTLMPAEFTVG